MNINSQKKIKAMIMETCAKTYYSKQASIQKRTAHKIQISLTSLAHRKQNFRLLN